MATRDEGKPKRSRRERARGIALVCVAAIAVLFAALNTGTVDVNWIVGKSSAPLIVVVGIAFLLGIICCYLVERIRARRGGRS